ncbi:uncharacterized protein LOC129984694 isoform X2 [Argiope bruennichi]|nr:uncharacterized protein LOC129984694 isoform X2 [Argiope bruennichi]
MLEPEILLNLPFNSRALEDYCEHFLNYYKCVDKYREEFAEDKVEYLTLSLIKAEPFMRKKLCKQTSINQRYIMHAPCLEAVSHQFYDYFDFADSLIKKYNAQEPLPNKFMAVSYYCLSASVSLTCLGISVSKSCGPDAKKLYIQVFEGTKFYSNVCPEFEFEYAERRAQLIWLATGKDICDIFHG